MKPAVIVGRADLESLLDDAIARARALPPKKMLTINEVADILGLKRTAVRTAAVNGDLPAVQLGGAGGSWRFPAEKIWRMATEGGGQ